MTFRPLLSLRLSHDFYGSIPPPVSVRPVDAAMFARAGLILRQLGADIRILGEEVPHAAVILDLVAEDRALLALTAGADWAQVPVFDPDGDLDLSLAQPSDTLPRDGGSGLLSPLLARLRLKVPEAPADYTLSFRAVKSVWRYHVVMPGEDEISVVDPSGQIGFEDAGTSPLADGRTARIFQSTGPVGISARPGQRFQLQRQGPFGPETVIPVLPAADAAPIRAGDPPALRSDIYVTLW